MGYSNTKCPNVHKLGCEFYVDRFFCPEHCEGFPEVQEEIKNDVKIVEKNIFTKKEK